ncbi:MAG: phosphate/phosphite/phosphonate ABC transporter substrate-binding protein [Desulfuromonadaceae bacterium]|nr:phosphate/phosphite/phosphonate ABC transporter substrate-binding protein [Desulfuromonadaceae bacterium]MDD2847250.1 phosphate/phosphite/phosphonate ABC transporter substrate-binding protein [Desulfuromonadaceae bacterium]MDD4130194.1 phosphate/phosphite/phosphonate ABC transporter substrate-binding protein [Desulfuromonadaceae bacterium]
MLGIVIKPTARFVFLLLIVWGVVVPHQSPAHEAPNIIKFAVYPYKSPRSVIKVFGPIAARLEKKLGQRVELVSAPDMQTFLAKGLAGEYDLILSPPTLYYKMQPVGYMPIARGVPSFWGGAIVRRDSTIRNIEQCRGKKVAAIGKFSYAGYMFFKAALVEHRINPAKDLDIQFLGKVDTVIYGVLNKKYDVGLLRLDTLDTPDFIALKDQFHVIVRSAEIPQFPFVVKKSMNQRTASAIREVLVSLSPDTPEDLEILKSLQISRIVSATKDDYKPFYKVVKDTEFFRQY